MDDECSWLKAAIFALYKIKKSCALIESDLLKVL